MGEDPRPPGMVERIAECAFCGERMMLDCDPACPVELLEKLSRLAICTTCAAQREWEHKRWQERRALMQSQCKLRP